MKSFISENFLSPVRVMSKDCISAILLLIISPLSCGVDLADVPLPSANTTVVKPNIFFVLDDSGSMAWDFMPDNIDTGTVGYRSSVCNMIYYNPSTKYVIPKDYNGDDVNHATQTSFTAAYDDGFSCYVAGGSSPETCTASGTSDLTNQYYWTYVGGGTLPSPLSTQCNYYPYSSSTTGICSDGSSVSNSPPTCSGSKTLLWKKVTVKATSGTGGADERQNFANWYTYYSTRLNMMKSASGRAFGGLSSSYRLGFMTIHPGTVDSSGNPRGGSTTVGTTKFLKIDDFSSDHRKNWFNKLYSQTANGNTPLRTALSIAGRYYAGKSDKINAGDITVDNPDPVQYSCQQNFTILTTDGYWNSGSGYKLDGTSAMDNQDGDSSEMDAYNTPAAAKFAMSLRPMYDGSTTTVVKNDTSSLYRLATCATAQQPQQDVIQWQSKITQLQKQTSQLQRRTLTFKKCLPGTSTCRSTALTFDCRPPTGTQDATYSECQVSYSNWSNLFAKSCTPTYNTECRTSLVASWTNASSCSAGTNSSGVVTECQTIVTQDWTNSGACSAGSLGSGRTLACRVASDTGWQNVSSCSASDSSSGPTTTCQMVNVTGSKLQVQTTVTTTTTVNTDKTGTPTTTTATPSAWTDVSDVCSLPANAPVLPSPNPTVTSTSSSSSSGGSSNTLSDVTQYYYKTDLRPTGATGAGGADVSENNVRQGGRNNEDDRANWQHMTTFTMGLGVSGTLDFSQDYKTAATGVFPHIRGTDPVVNWPLPVSNGATTLDDLWHAAVNGRGTYFSAGRPDDVIVGLNSALASIQAINGAGAAAATASVDQADGKNYTYKALYKTQVWTGEIESHPIDPVSGAVGATVIWSAQTKLNSQIGNACDNRSIKLFRSGAAGNLIDFTWDTSLCDTSGSPTGTASSMLNATEKANFSSTQVALLSQYSQMTDGSSGTADQKGSAPGANLVNFLRGQRGMEGFAPNTTKLYRQREHPFGDVVNAKPLYLGAPTYLYADAGYSDWKKTDAVKNRSSMLYVAANDGMLHAFYAGDSVTDANAGKEAWAFIPTSALSGLYKLADTAYATNHQYYVDGSPAYGDVYDQANDVWKTILVGGSNKGGKTYYALDVTDPASLKHCGSSQIVIWVTHTGIQK